MSIRTLLAVLLLVAVPAAAQQSQPPTQIAKPPAQKSKPVLQPLPEPPPPPPGFELDPVLEPQVTIHKRGADTVEEYRLNGKLYMMKVTPPGGRPYYMVDHRGDGTFARQDNYDSGVRPPMWVIIQF